MKKKTILETIAGTKTDRNSVAIIDKRNYELLKQCQLPISEQEKRELTNADFENNLLLDISQN